MSEDSPQLSVAEGEDGTEEEEEEKSAEEKSESESESSDEDTPFPSSIENNEDPMSVDGESCYPFTLMGGWKRTVSVMYIYMFLSLSLCSYCFLIALSVDEEGKIPPPADLPEPLPDPITPNPDPVVSNPDPVTVGSWIQDSLKSTMWLGTEDGW